MKILSLIESYLPGKRGGGPVRALHNLTGALQPEHEFFILTRSYDYQDASPYQDVAVGQWLDVGAAKVKYLNDRLWEEAVVQALEEIRPDWVYLNGAFPPLTRFYLQYRRGNRKVQEVPVLIAPHGNLSPVTLNHNRWRKRAWIFFAKAFSLYRGVHWHAASIREQKQIQAVWGKEAKIRTISMAVARESGVEKRVGANALPPIGMGMRRDLHLLYFGRLCREKNLSFALGLLEEFARKFPGKQILYELVGPEDENYGQLLRERAARLPASIRVEFRPAVDPDALQSYLHYLGSRENSVATALLLPSETENFSFTILESLQAGLPVIISDQTPWQDLEKEGIGWDLPLPTKAKLESGYKPWLKAMEEILEEKKTMVRRRETVLEYSRNWVEEKNELLKVLFVKESE